MYEWIKTHKFMAVVILGLVIASILQAFLIAQFISVLYMF